jgi:DDE superfamily endonuclease
MNGERLLPFIVLVGTPNGRIERNCYRTGSPFPADCIYASQKKGWVDYSTFDKWVDTVWQPFITGKPKTLLLMDSYSVHLMPPLLQKLQNMGTHVIFIPKGYTGKLQVLDVGVNRPFKHYVRAAFRRFQIHTQNAKPQHLDVALWISEAWGKITASNITNTWRHFGVQHPENVAEDSDMDEQQ